MSWSVLDASFEGLVVKTELNGFSLSGVLAARCKY
jgi:hypothetical protein